jgi:hypothetical protein
MPAVDYSNLRLPVKPLKVIPTIAKNAESNDLLRLRPRAFRVFSLDPDFVNVAGPEPDLRKTAIVCEATRVLSINGRVYLDDATPPQPEDVSTYELVDYEEQQSLVDQMTYRQKVAEAERRKTARKPPQVVAAQPFLKRARSMTSIAVNDARSGGPFALDDDDDQLVTNSSEATCPETQAADELDEFDDSIETTDPVVSFFFSL